MRFEGHHNTFKRISKISCNFKNIPRSTAVHLNIKFCLAMLDESVFIEKNVILGPFTESAVAKVFDASTCEPHTNLCLDRPVLIPNWVLVGGWKYLKGSVLVLESSRYTNCGFPTLVAIDSSYCSK